MDESHCGNNPLLCFAGALGADAEATEAAETAEEAEAAEAGQLPNGGPTAPTPAHRSHSPYQHDQDEHDGNRETKWREQQTASVRTGEQKRRHWTKKQQQRERKDERPHCHHSHNPSWRTVSMKKWRWTHGDHLVHLVSSSAPTLLFAPLRSDEAAGSIHVFLDYLLHL